MRADHTSYSDAVLYQPKEPRVYSIFRLMGFPFRFEVLGLQHVQGPGPALFLCNHLGAVGPLAVMISVPIRFHPWIISEMMNFASAPQYLYDDFVHPKLHLRGKVGLLFSTFLSKIAVRLFRTIDAVSIDRFGGLSVDGFRHSLQLLRAQENLLIFPEDALGPLNAQSQMRPFMPGFASLCHMFQSTHHELLPVYPVAVHPGSEMVSIGRAEFFRVGVNLKDSTSAFSSLLEARVRGLFLDLQQDYEQLMA